jgi:signal transduction histidine kinase
LKLRTRLAISNLLMLVIPVTVSLAVYYGGLRVFAAVTGLRDSQREWRGTMDVIGAAIREMDEWEERGAALSEMLPEARGFNAHNAGRGLALLIYKNGQPINEPPQWRSDDILDLALARGDRVTYFGRTAAWTRTINGYRVVLLENLRISEMTGGYRDVMFKGTALSLVVAAVMVVLMNKLLTQFVFGKILSAMDTLSGGAHEIRDGNLDFRIDYSHGDEFAPVCGDFNEMAERLQMAAQARLKDEMSRRELFAGISHDLRTPLTSIKAYVEGLEKGVASTSEARARYLGTIKSKADDLEHIIEALFLFSKLDTGEFPYSMERADLSAAVADITGEAAAEYAAMGLDITARADENPVWVNIDVSQLRRVMINIFENSLKYKTSRRGRLDVSVSRAGDTAVLALTDDGPGVPVDAADKLFDMFYRLDLSRSDPSKGSGLGLAIAAKVIENFGGAIEAKNALSSGLSIIIKLPSA